MINLTLNQLKRPALSNLVPTFGTKVEKNDINKGGLSTEEVDKNITLPFELMREVEVSSSDTTTKIQYDAKIAIVGSSPVTLTLDKASYKGCVITITNRSIEQATIVLSEDNQKNIESKKSLVLEWDGTAWNDTALVVDSTVSEDSNKPVSSAAVYQKATEITEAYTQAIAGETTARSEAITAVERKVTEETDARTQADTALGTRIDTEVGTLSALTTTAKDNVVAAINEVNGKVGTGGGGDTGSTASNCEQFTFVVDSNEKLTAWANNDKASGQDYTSVLIRKGEWTSNTRVNLTTAGTKVVVGELGSKLVFNNVENGLYYATAPTGPDYYMRGVNVVVTMEGTGEITGNSFYNCTNLTNCTGSTLVTGDGSGQITSNSFDTCKNLIDCTGTGTGTNPVDSSRYNGLGRGFYNCTNLTNCTGNGSGKSKTNGNGDGFSSCTNLTNCTGNGSGTVESIGFYNCTSLTNCTGLGLDSGSWSSYGFVSCTNLTNCTGTGTGTGYGAGFYYCRHLTNCIGTGKATGSNSPKGYGFSGCNCVIGCRVGGVCSSGAFRNCYASRSETSTYACADTANGGFNNVKNSYPNA